MVKNFALTDNTDPRLPDSYWGPGGAAEKMLVGVKSPDGDLAVTFEKGQEHVPLSLFKPGVEVPVQFVYSGKRDLFGSQVVAIKPEFSIFPSQSAPPDAKNLKTYLKYGDAHDYIVPPLIHPAAVAGFFLFVVIAGGVGGLIASKNRAKREQDKKEALRKPRA